MLASCTVDHYLYLLIQFTRLSDYPEIKPTKDVFLRVDGAIPDSASKK